MTTDSNQKVVFWGCFIALITTSFAFISRAFLVNDPALWPAEFGLNQVQAQELFGAGIWPFAISIILFSLVIDRIGYRMAMLFSFVCYAVYAMLALQAHGIVHPEGEALAGEALQQARADALSKLTLGSIVLGLGNGTVEAFINPVVATLFPREKTKWLNILHAGWPGGLVLGGILTILLGGAAAEDWRILVYIIAIPAVVYVFMLFRAEFPVNERVASGVTYREMLAEFGVLGALIAAFLVFKQLGMVFVWDDGLTWGLVFASVAAYAAYCRSLGRPMMILLCLIMMPLATTELGTDGAITGIMEEPLKEAGWHPLWVLIYTSAIMMVLRFFAGAIVHRINPLGLLMSCAVLAIAGLWALSGASGLAMIFLAATLYGVGKTFFWPTMLGVVAEQYPKGGAVTLNSIAGIGMLTVGIVGGPLIGAMQEKSAQVALEAKADALPGIYAQISSPNSYFLGEYTAVDGAKVAALPEAQQAEIQATVKEAKQGALADVTVFPLIMLVGYIGMFLYFRGRGGYKAVELTGAQAAGGVAGAAEM
ncbi:MAG: MFS transporter [Planctomycetota bacterium]|nr:MFS transporter [Planctomycetota bacterium]MDA1222109.1 MFS transporter [Planctomycetota bacterium]